MNNINGGSGEWYEFWNWSWGMAIFFFLFMIVVCIGVYKYGSTSNKIYAAVGGVISFVLMVGSILMYKAKEE